MARRGFWQGEVVAPQRLRTCHFAGIVPVHISRLRKRPWHAMQKPVMCGAAADGTSMQVFAEGRWADEHGSLRSRVPSAAPSVQKIKRGVEKE